jgi:hypothetical protein
MTTSTLSIADLINLLDKDTLDALSARLVAVASRLKESTQDTSDFSSEPSQMLFEFIDAGIAGTEEYLDRGNTAMAILEQIEE